jgi:endo-1,4-beta-xylanase
MTVWGVSDKYSWIPGVFPGEGSGLLFDDDYKKKPSYYGFLRGIEGPKKP